MSKAIRFDQGTLRKPERTPQGFLRVDAMAARVGVQEYRNRDGSIRRELRLPEEVRRLDSLAGYEGVSVTDGHPTVLVDSNNVRTLEAGTVTGAARMDGDWVVTPLVIKDPRLIAKVEGGKTAVSVGYTIREDHTPGVHPVYGPYDLIQRDITPNHIACAVAIPRAGDAARIRMDGADVDVAMQIDRSGERTEIEHMPREKPSETDTDLVVLQTKLKEIEARAAQAEADLKTRTDELSVATNQVAAFKAQADDAKTRLDAGSAAAESEALTEKQTRIDSLERELAEIKRAQPELIRQRSQLNDRVRSVMGADYRADAMDEAAALVAGIQRFEPKADLSKESLVGLRARFDAHFEGRANSAASLKRASADMAVRTDAVKHNEVDPFDPLNNGAGPWASPHATKKGA